MPYSRSPNPALTLHNYQLFKNNPKNGDCLQKTAFFWPLFEKTILERLPKNQQTSHTTALKYQIMGIICFLSPNSCQFIPLSRIDPRCLVKTLARNPFLGAFGLSGLGAAHSSPFTTQLPNYSTI
jgi:hypothetical protein